MAKKIIGVNYLHTHDHTEYKLGIDNSHIIVDKKEYEEVIKFFQQRPLLFDILTNQTEINLGCLHQRRQYIPEFNKDLCLVCGELH